MHAKHILAAFATIPLAHAAVWNITVAGSGLTFTPNTVTAAAGDMLHFTFAAAGHSVTQGTFDAPCTKMAGGFDSGLSAGPTTFDVMVNSTDPIWIHCEQVGHCPAGMVFAANPTSTQTFAAFQAAAEGKSSNAGGSSSSAAAAAATTGSTSSGAYGNDASALELKGWMVGVAAFIGAAAMI